MDANDKIRDVVPLLQVMGEIGNREPQVLIFDVGMHLVHLLQCFRRFLFPRLRIRDDMRDVALLWMRAPDRFSRLKRDGLRGAEP